MFRYLKDKEDRLVFILLYNLRTRDITSIKTNIKIKRVRDLFYKIERLSYSYKKRRT